MPVRTDMAVFGAELKRWRQHRRYSQLDLANQAEVSQRHLSFLETGRSRPSPEMIEHLSVVAESADLRLYTAISSLAAAGDVTLEELRLETLLPADPETAEELRRLCTTAESPEPKS